MVRAFTERRLDEAWRSRGVCQRHDPETFFPAPSEPPDTALALCRGCDVQGACLAWALDAGDCHGVWGATTPRERRAMAVVWRGETDETPVPACGPVSPSRLGTLVLLPSPRRPAVGETLDCPVSVAS